MIDIITKQHFDSHLFFYTILNDSGGQYWTIVADGDSEWIIRVFYKCTDGREDVELKRLDGGIMRYMKDGVSASEASDAALESVQEIKMT